VQLQAAAQVAHATTSVLDPDALLRQVVELVRERFNLYYVGLFLLDPDKRFAVLHAGTGEAGQQMLAQGHKLEVGGGSMIGQCVTRGEARIALDVGAEAVRFDNPLLPNTRSEMALPLRSRGQVIGAMTVQSARAAAFDEADIAIMQTMADQVAVAIDNARLFTAAQAALQEMEVTQRRYMAQAWAEYMRGRTASGYEQAGEALTPLGAQVLPEVQLAVSQLHPVVKRGDGGSGQAESQATLVAPILLRGQPIGALGLKAPEKDRQWSAEDIALAEAISEQFALAAENLRLLDETQRRAAQERLIGEVTSRIRESLDVETVLKTTASEMRQALDLDNLVIRLATPEVDALPNRREKGRDHVG
jgi:GAF domain-containing protein